MSVFMMLQVAGDPSRLADVTWQPMDTPDQF